MQFKTLYTLAHVRGQKIPNRTADQINTQHGILCPCQSTKFLPTAQALTLFLTNILYDILCRIGHEAVSALTVCSSTSLGTCSLDTSHRLFQGLLRQDKLTAKKSALLNKLSAGVLVLVHAQNKGDVGNTLVFQGTTKIVTVEPNLQASLCQSPRHTPSNPPICLTTQQTVLTLYFHARHPPFLTYYVPLLYLVVKTIATYITNLQWHQ